MAWLLKPTAMRYLDMLVGACMVEQGPLQLLQFRVSHECRECCSVGDTPGRWHARCYDHGRGNTGDHNSHQLIFVCSSAGRQVWHLQDAEVLHGAHFVHCEGGVLVQGRRV
eukprot:41834-Chlamydomonas_euryale.AAC.2